MSSRTEEARTAARALLDDLEVSNAEIGPILMKAKRLARLMRDGDAQVWLDLETAGYPENFNYGKLGTCRKYAEAGGRINSVSKKYWRQSLPEIEAHLESDGAILDSIRTSPGPPAKAKDYLEKGATESLLATHLKVQQNQRETHAAHKKLYSGLQSAVHSYATDVYIALELGDAAETIFEAARTTVDQFIAARCPQGAEKLVAINERMAEDSPESWVAALTSCRRLLLDVADAVFPPQGDPYEDSSGKQRAVGPDEYKNRIMAYLDESSRSRGSVKIIESGLEHLAARLDAIYEKTCKGVHAEVSKQEARLAVVHTYLFIGEVASADGTGGDD